MKCWMVSYEFPLRFHGSEGSTAEKWLAPQGPYDIRIAGVYNRSCWLPKHKNLSTHAKKIMNTVGELQVVVSTKASGMGINQPDVELVVCTLP